MTTFQDGLRARPAVIAVLHAPPLPGAARAALALETITAHVVSDAAAAAAGGADALLLENFGDAPFTRRRVGPEVVAVMTRLALAVRAAAPLPLGINVLRNDACAALAIAQAAGGSFIRVNVLAGVVATDQGLVMGEAARVLAFRRRIGAEGIAILADVDVKHGRPLWGESIAGRAADLCERSLADALIVTGPATGEAPILEDLEHVRRACPGMPILAGSGVTPANAARLLPGCRGVIAGTGLKIGGQVAAPIARERVAELVTAARSAWASAPP
jgi:membrane complex biogenesis BtpA family protein